MRKTIMKHVTVAELAEMVRGLDKPGEQVRFAVRQPDYSSFESGDARKLWAASRVAIGAEQYVVFHSCGSSTINAASFCTREDITKADVSDLTARIANAPFYEIAVEVSAPSPKKIDIQTVAEQVGQEMHRLLDEYFGPGELSLRIEDGNTACIARADDGRIWVEPNGALNMKELWECSDAAIITAYGSLLDYIDKELNAR